MGYRDWKTRAADREIWKIEYRMVLMAKNPMKKKNWLLARDLFLNFDSKKLTLDPKNVYYPYPLVYRYMEKLIRLTLSSHEIFIFLTICDQIIHNN